MLHTLGYWRPTLGTFPESPAPTNTPKMQELRKTNPEQYDKIVAESRRVSTELTRDYSKYDEETVAAVDKFRTDRGLNYQGNPAGLVDARMVDALRAAYFEAKKNPPTR
jgi:hypothetical protein